MGNRLLELWDRTRGAWWCPALLVSMVGWGLFMRAAPAIAGAVIGYMGLLALVAIGAILHRLVVRLEDGVSLSMPAAACRFLDLLAKAELGGPPHQLHVTCAACQAPAVLVVDRVATVEWSCSECCALQRLTVHQYNNQTATGTVANRGTA